MKGFSSHSQATGSSTSRVEKAKIAASEPLQLTRPYHSAWAERARSAAVGAMPLSDRTPQDEKRMLASKRLHQALLAQKCSDWTSWVWPLCCARSRCWTAGTVCLRHLRPTTSLRCHHGDGCCRPIRVPADRKQVDLQKAPACR